jgi:hypothetical protein
LGPRQAKQAENKSLAQETLLVGAATEKSLAQETLLVGAATENFERERKFGHPSRRLATNENLGGKNALALNSRAGENGKRRRRN